MSFRLYKPFFFTFVMAVLLLQNLSIGYCTSRNTLFFSECPAHQSEGDVHSSRATTDSCCEERCPCEKEGDNCSEFLSLRLDEFSEIQPSRSVPEVISVSLVSDLIYFFRDLAAPPPVYTRNLFHSRPPDTGVSILLRYSVALI